MQLIEVGHSRDGQLGGTEAPGGAQLQLEAHHLNLGHEPPLEERLLQISQQWPPCKMSRQPGATLQGRSTRWTAESRLQILIRQLLIGSQRATIAAITQMAGTPLVGGQRLFGKSWPPKLLFY